MSTPNILLANPPPVESVTLVLTKEHALVPPDEKITPGRLKGWIPESYLCVDCGFNTGPGQHNRVEAELAFMSGRDGIASRYTSESELYAVKDKVWRLAKMKQDGGCLCIGCLEKRLGRRLQPKDFPITEPLNDPHLPCTERLRKRRGV